MDSKKFLTNSTETGRLIVTSLRTGKKFYIEAIGNPKTNWGDINTASKKIEGTYGSKYKGSIDAEESLITEENGFFNISFVHGGSPFHKIEELDKNYPNLKK